MGQKFYVYAHIRLDTGEIFYVGKGIRNRCHRKERNQHWKHIAEKAGYSIKFLEENLEENQAFELERFWIKFYKEKGQCVANYALGGEGCSGVKWSKEQRKRHSEKQRQKTDSIMNGHKKQAEKIRGRTKETHPGVKIISEKNKGENNGRAIWNILTPDGKFSTIREVAKFYRICPAAVHRRLASTTGRFKGWKKEAK